MNKLFNLIFCAICLTFVSCADIFTDVEAQPVYTYTYYYGGTYYPVKYYNTYPYYYFNYRWVPIPRERYGHIGHNHHVHHQHEHHRPSNSYYQHKPNRYNHHNHNYNHSVRKPNNMQRRTINKRPHNTGRK